MNTKDKLIAAYSKLLHNLRNANASMDSFVKIIEAKTIDIYDTTRFNLVEEIKIKNSYSYYELENIKDLTNLSKENSEANIEEVNINNILHSITTEMKAIIAFNKVTIKSVIDENHSVNWDEYQLRRCILNILFNAINFAEKDSEITIKSEIINNKTILSIQNNGPSINDTTLNNIKSLELCAPTNGTKGYKGLGIGLLICSIFAEMNNAEINFDSMLDKGTKVSLEV